MFRNFKLKEDTHRHLKAFAAYSDLPLSETIDLTLAAARLIGEGSSASGANGYSAFILLFEAYKARNAIKPNEAKIFWHYLGQNQGRELLRKMYEAGEAARIAFEESENGQKIMLLAKNSKTDASGKPLAA